MTIKQLLEQRFRDAMIAAGAPEDCNPHITRSNKPQFGDFQANGAMAAAKAMGTNPRALAGNILEKLDLTGIADKTEIAGPGFINIHLASDFLSQQLSALAQDNQLGTTQPSVPQTVVVDYSAPNLAKEMHVGHLRSTIIGDAIARVLEFQGHKVIRQNHMGDWGTQFGMLIAELEEHLGEGEEPAMALHDLETFYQQAKRHFDSDEAFAEKSRAYVVKLQSGDEHCRKLWQQFITISIHHSEEIYQKLNVTLGRDHIAPESQYNPALPEVISRLKASGIAVDDQGAVVVFLDELADKNGNPSPFIVQKSGGGYLYATTDLAAMDYRCHSLKADRIVIFTDARQSLHFKQLELVSRKAGFAPETVLFQHSPFGTMMGKDGKPFKTRTGGTVKLAELLTEAIERADALIAEKNPDIDSQTRTDIARKVGIGAVKYADLSKTRTNDYIFDWDAMLSFEGNTAPYLQYAYTRIQSIFRKAAIDPAIYSAEIAIDSPQERALAKQILQFSEAVDTVAADAMPHVLCAYLYDLASLFMSFYENCPILKDGIDDATRNSRLQLSLITANTLCTGLNLLGIETMEQM